MPLFAQHALLAEGWASNVRLTVADGRLERVAVDTAATDADECVDIVIPGLCNAHSHAFQRALTGRAERRSANAADTFWTWRHLMYGLADRIGPADLFAIARQLYTEMVMSGYTSVVEFHYLHRAQDAALSSANMLQPLLLAARDSGIRLTFVPVLYERADFDQPTVARGQRSFYLSLDNYLAYVADAQRQLEAPHGVGLGAHSLRAVTPGSLTQLVAAAEQMDLPLHLHVAEQQREVQHCIQHYGARPVRWLLDQFNVDSRWTLVHATHMDADERRQLAASGAVACLCPSTEGNLGDGLFPLRDYLREGGAFSIGSDSHVTVNPFEELRWLEYGQRLAVQQRNVAATGQQGSGERLYYAALAGGSQSAGHAVGPSLPGGLRAGGPADVLALNAQSPALLGHEVETLLDALVFAGQPLPVDRVMINGRWVVINGKHEAARVAADEYAKTLRSLLPAIESAS